MFYSSPVYIIQGLQGIVNVDYGEYTELLNRIKYEEIKTDKKNPLQELIDGDLTTGNVTDDIIGLKKASEKDENLALIFNYLWNNKSTEKAMQFLKDMSAEIEKVNKHYDWLLDNNYEISQSIGNMLPSIGISLINPGLGTVSMGLSAGGNASHQALVAGASEQTAIVYGTLIGLSEAGLERVLGGITGLSDVNIVDFKSYLVSMGKEGFEEFIQAYIENGLNTGLLGEDFDLMSTSLEAVKSAMYGSITAGVMNSASLGVNKINQSINNRIDGINHLNNDIEILENTTEKEVEPIIFDFETFLNGKTFFNHNLSTFVGASYFNSFILNESNYNSLLEAISKADKQTNLNMLDMFHQLKKTLNESHALLDEVVETRLNQLNKLYYKFLNSNTEILSQYKEYGANQDSVRRLAKNPLKNMKLYKQCEEIVENYFKDISKFSINKLLSRMNTNGICSYATFVNNLVTQYEGREAEFKSKFGFDLYRIENGVKVLNDELILTDLYCFANQQNENIIKQENGKYIIAKDDSKHIALSYLYSDSTNPVIINDWFASKGMNDFIFSDSCENLASIYGDDNLVDNMPEAVAKYFKNGSTTVEIVVFATPESGYTLYSTDPKVYGNPFIGSGGHSLMITGLTEAGDFIVSSWGKEYVLLVSELKNVECNFYFYTWRSGE